MAPPLQRVALVNGRCQTGSVMKIRPIIRWGIGCRPDPVSRQSHKKAAQARQRRAQIMAVDHHVDHAVFLQEFGLLESVGQVLADRLLNHPRTGETDQGSWLGHMNITQHRIGGRDAARGRIGENDDIGYLSLA
jgi:hypothetical protein